MWMPRSYAILIYTFHMPLLFMVSGYLHKNHSILHVVKSLWIPVVLISLSMLFFNIAEISIKGGKIIDYIRNLVWLDYRDDFGSGLFTGVWFIEALFLCRIFLLFFRTYYIHVAIVCIVIMSLFPLLESDIWHYYPMRFFSCFPFVALGIWLKERQWNPSYISWKEISIGIVIFLWAWLVDGGHSLHCNSFGYSYISFFISSVATSAILAKICIMLPECRFVTTISVGTLFILGTHSIMIEYLTPFLPGKLWNVSYFIIPITIVLIDYFLIMFCLNHCPILLGKIANSSVH